MQPTAYGVQSHHEVVNNSFTVNDWIIDHDPLSSLIATRPIDLLNLPVLQSITAAALSSSHNVKQGYDYCCQGRASLNYKAVHWTQKARNKNNNKRKQMVIQSRRLLFRSNIVNWCRMLTHFWLITAPVVIPLDANPKKKKKNVSKCCSVLAWDEVNGSEVLIWSGLNSARAC